MDESKENHKLVAVAVCGAFMLGVIRGGYLLGWLSGLMLGGFLAFSTFLVWDAFHSDARFRIVRRIATVCFFAFVVAFVLIPTWISQDIQYSIDQTANERQMRSELIHVFRTDARFSSLRSKFTQLKCTNIELSGSLPDASSLDDARAAIGASCPTVCEMALVSWNVHLRDSGERITTNDGRMGQQDSGNDDAG